MNVKEVILHSPIMFLPFQSRAIHNLFQNTLNDVLHFASQMVYGYVLSTTMRLRLRRNSPLWRGL